MHPQKLHIHRKLMLSIFSTFLFASCFPITSAAASFNCKKASTGLEKKICLDRVLSDLDDELAAIYAIALKSAVKRQDLIAGQRNWITEVRNKCAGWVCLSLRYSERISELRDEVAEKEPRPSCGIDDPTFVGDWRRLEDGNFGKFSAVTRGKKRIFSSPDYYGRVYRGTWKLENCVLYLVSTSQKIPGYEYDVIGIANGVLALKNVQTSESSFYRRVGK
jgi:uncharacterized protein